MNKIAGQVEEITAEFAEQVDVVAKIRQEDFPEQLQKRLADVAIDLFGMIGAFANDGGDQRERRRERSA